MKLGNGIRVNKTFDKRYYTQTITNSTAGIFGRSYLYDHNGNIRQLLDLIDSTKSYHTIPYEGVDRLTQAYGQYRTDSLFYTYAKNGNRWTKRKGNQSATNYSYINNRLRNTTGAEVVNYGYNPNGSVIGDTLSGQTKVYSYDKLNRIVKVTGITPADSFAYDGENKRVYSNESGFEFVNIYDIFGNLISQWWVNSPFYFTDYVWANGEPRMRIDTLELLGLLDEPNGGPPPSGPETRYWFHTDHLGTPYVFTDSNKAVMWRLSTDPFGEVVSELTPPQYDENLRFPGQYADRSTGLNYNWHRYYQAKIGRYYQVDPEFSQASINPFVYAKNNSLSFIDETGEQFSFVQRTRTAIECGFAMRDRATSKARKTDKVEEGPNVLDGKRDALKHCYGICLIHSVCGPIVAHLGGSGKEITDIVEGIFKGVPKKKRAERKYMDTENNRHGRECARNAECDKLSDPCFECCLGKLNSGTLVVIKDKKKGAR